MVSEATQLSALACSQAVGAPLFHIPSGSLQPGVVEVTEDIFTSVQLGPLLGKGSFGKVFRGSWQSQPVAVKVPHAPSSCASVGTSACALLVLL